jgi:hypothetical protein
MNLPLGLIRTFLLAASVSLAAENPQPTPKKEWALPDGSPGTGVAKELTAEEKAAGWQLLFDGKSLDGWKPTGSTTTFKVTDGAIVAQGDMAYLHYVGEIQKHDFKNFEFELEVMTFPGANSGVFFHAPGEARATPRCYEVQINNSPKDPSRSGGLWGIQDNYDDVAKDREWFTMRIKVLGKRIVVWVNDRVTCDYTEAKKVERPQKLSEKRLSHGTFVLQAIGGKVMFRSIRVRATP